MSTFKQVYIELYITFIGLSKRERKREIERKRINRKSIVRSINDGGLALKMSSQPRRCKSGRDQNTVQ